MLGKDLEINCMYCCSLDVLFPLLCWLFRQKKYLFIYLFWGEGEGVIVFLLFDNKVVFHVFVKDSIAYIFYFYIETRR